MGGLEIAQDSQLQPTDGKCNGPDPSTNRKTHLVDFGKLALVSRVTLARKIRRVECLRRCLSREAVPYHGIRHTSRLPLMPARRPHLAVIALCLHILESDGAWSGPAAVHSCACGQAPLPMQKARSLRLRMDASLLGPEHVASARALSFDIVKGLIDSDVAAEYAARTGAGPYMAFSTSAMALMTCLALGEFFVFVAERFGVAPWTEPDGGLAQASSSASWSSATAPDTLAPLQSLPQRQCTRSTRLEMQLSRPSDDADDSNGFDAATHAKQAWKKSDATKAADDLNKRIDELRALREREESLRAALLEAIDMEAYRTAASIQKELDAHVLEHSYEQLEGPS